MSLNYTSLRHRMLAKIRDGRLEVYVGFKWNLRDTDTDEWIKGVIVRTLHESGWVQPMRLRAGTSSPASLTVAGLTQLAAWSSQHGDPGERR